LDRFLANQVLQAAAYFSESYQGKYPHLNVNSGNQELQSSKKTGLYPHS